MRGSRNGSSGQPPSHPPARRARSLRRDLGFGFGFGILLVWFLALLAGWGVLRGEIDEIYDASLERTADRLMMLSGSSGPSGAEGVFVELIAPDGQVLLRTQGLDPSLFAAATREGITEIGDMRVLMQRGEDGSTLRIADPLAERREAARETLVAMLVPSVVLMPLALVGAIWFTRRRLAPVTDLSEEVAGRGAKDLRPLSPRPLPLELEPIRAAVDQLMAQLSDALSAERAFSANAAHELRTPIAATLAQTQRLIAEADTPALRQRADGIATSLQRLSRLSEKLLDLARAEGVTAQNDMAHDMAPVLQLVVSDFGEGLRVAMSDGPIPIRMDVDAFAVMARNLIENAKIHGEAPVSVTLSPRALVVENAGPVVATEVLARLSRRFERGGSRKSGSGLGLAIVETVARNAGARLDLISPAPGREDGFAARVSFPGNADLPSEGSLPEV